MSTDQGADERRIRHLLQARGVSYTPDTPPPAKGWWDRLYDDEPPAPRAAVPPSEPPRPPKVTAEDTPGEPRWDWRRLLHWPYARLTLGATAALIPWHRGTSAATGWGEVLRSYRTGAGIGAAWTVAGVGLITAAVLVHQRRWYGWLLLTSAFIGIVYMASPFDLVTFLTGATQ
jgi:hypothetical protein